jgi:putative pyruvate formate lyase activating enzyme
MTYKKCELCPRECGADRTVSHGFCLGGACANVTRAAKHFWEEPVISGKNGSGTIFFSGCTMRCVYCQNSEISRDISGRNVSDEELCEIILSLQNDGAENINLVNPVHFAPSIKNALLAAKPSIPVVWNSGGWERVETLREMEGLIDIYLPDFKYFSDEKALKYSGIGDYAQTAANAINEMFRQVGDVVIENGLMKKGVIVRHLVLPSMSVQSVKALRFMRENLPDGVWVSLMGQYIPAGDVSSENFPEINRKITIKEYNTVLREFRNLGFDGFCQELSSASEDFVPVLKD